MSFSRTKTYPVASAAPPSIPNTNERSFASRVDRASIGFAVTVAATLFCAFSLAAHDQGAPSARCNCMAVEAASPGWLMSDAKWILLPASVDAATDVADCSSGSAARARI